MTNVLMAAFWVAAATAFGFWILATQGPDRASQFMTCYMLEKTLSLDNLFVFFLIFKSFNIKRRDQRWYLQWGIVGAFVLRFLFITIGVGAVHLFPPLLMLMGAFLVWTGWKVFKGGDDEQDAPSPVGRSLPTWLMVIATIEVSDIIFAFDSVPASLAVSQDPFIVYTANMFAVIGLRSLYFVLIDLINKFQYMNAGVGVVLGFIGLKLLIQPWLKISNEYSLIIVALVLLASILYSIIKTSNTGSVEDESEIHPGV